MNENKLVHIIDHNTRVIDVFIDDFKGELHRHACDISSIIKKHSKLGRKVCLYTLAFWGFTTVAVHYLNKHEREIEELKREVEEFKHMKGI